MFLTKPVLFRTWVRLQKLMIYGNPKYVLLKSIVWSPWKLLILHIYKNQNKNCTLENTFTFIKIRLNKIIHQPNKIKLYLDYSCTQFTLITYINGPSVEGLVSQQMDHINCKIWHFYSKRLSTVTNSPTKKTIVWTTEVIWAQNSERKVTRLNSWVTLFLKEGLEPIPRRLKRFRKS